MTHISSFLITDKTDFKKYRHNSAQEQQKRSNFVLKAVATNWFVLGRKHLSSLGISDK